MSSVRVVVSRSDRVDQAVQFLIHPTVKSASLRSKLAFLKRKGLSDEETALALSRAHPELASVALQIVASDASTSTLKSGDGRFSSINKLTFLKALAWTTATVASAISIFKLLSCYWLKPRSDRARICSLRRQRLLAEDTASIHEKLGELTQVLKQQSLETKRSLDAILAAVQRIRSPSLYQGGSEQESEVNSSSSIDHDDPVRQVALSDSIVLVSVAEAGPGEASLKRAFEALSEEPEHIRTPAVNALLMYLNKIIDAPEDSRLRKIVYSNRIFQERIAKVPAAEALLLSIGYIRGTGSLEWSPSADSNIASRSAYFDLVKKASELLENLRATTLVETDAFAQSS